MKTSEPNEAAALLANAAWVRRLARSLLGDAHLAEDVAQEALAAAWARSERFSDSSRLRRWLAGATRQLAWRVRARERERPAREARAASPESCDADDAERLRAHRRVVDAVLRLDEPYRQALILRYFDDLPPREIAGRLDIRPEAARQRVSRGLARLRARLDGEVEGGRAAWAAMLAPLADAPTSSLPLMAPEVMLVSAKTTAAIVAVAAAGLMWWLATGERPAAGSAAPAIVEREEAAAAGGADVEDAGEGAGGAPARQEAGAAAPAAEDALALFVRGEDGRPIGGADVVIRARGGEAARSATDAEGRARFEPTDEPVALAAAAPGFLVGGRMSDAGRGEIELTLRAAHVLEGRVLEDGAPLARPVRLRLRSNASAIDGLPPEVQELAAGLVDVAAERETRTDSDGRFRFGGLTADWSGKLLLPSTHWFIEAPAGSSLGVSDDDVLLLAAPVEGLELQTTRLATVRGRVVWADGSGPVAGCGLTVTGEFDGDRNAPMSFVEADDAGRFEFGLASGSSADRALWKDAARRPALARVTIYPDPEDGIQGEFRFEGAELADDGEVGDLPVVRGRRVHFVVRAPDGAPIEGARALCTSLSEPSDARGRGVLLGVTPDAREVLVGAPERRVLRLPLGPGGASPEEPLVFELPRGNVLELTLRDADGRPPEGVRLELSSETPLFEAGVDWGPTRVHYSLLDDHFQGASWNRGAGQLSLSVDFQGRASIYGIRDAVPVTVRVLDRLNQVVIEERFDGPGGGERLARTIEVPGETFELSGRVVDSSGAPLANVRVELRPERWKLAVHTGSDGRYTFAQLRELDEPCTLKAELRGYAARRVEGFELRPDARLPELALERGRGLRVRVVDEAGAPVDVGAVAASAPGHAHVWSKDVEPGLEQLDDLPPGPVTLTIRHGWRVYEQRDESGADEFRFVLPVHGTLELIAPEAAPRMSIGELCARVSAVDDPDVTGILSFEGVVGDRTEPVELLPGAYRVQLLHRWWAEGERHEQPLQGGWQVEVVAGANEAVRLGP